MFFQPGAIDRFNQDIQKITELVAKETESKGLFEDAIQLYDLAKVLFNKKFIKFLGKLVINL